MTSEKHTWSDVPEEFRQYTYSTLVDQYEQMLKAHDKARERGLIPLAERLKAQSVALDYALVELGYEWPPMKEEDSPARGWNTDISWTFDAREVPAPKWKPCADCGGTGDCRGKNAHEREWQECFTCDGSGEVPA